MGIVRIGFFKDFRSDDTLLLEGDQEGLRQLLEVIKELKSGKDDSVAMHILPFVEAHHGVRLLAQTTQKAQRIIKKNNLFKWLCTIADWEDVEDKITVLVEGSSGHQYFETSHDETIVMVSLGEYGPAWWEKHG